MVGLEVAPCWPHPAAKTAEATRAINVIFPRAARTMFAENVDIKSLHLRSRRLSEAPLHKNTSRCFIREFNPYGIGVWDDDSDTTYRRPVR